MARYVLLPARTLRSAGPADVQLSVSLQLCSRLRCRVLGLHAAPWRSGLLPSGSMLARAASRSAARLEAQARC